MGIVRNRCIDELRKRDVHERRRADAEALEDRFAAPDSTDGKALRAEQSMTVRTALAMLPNEQRQVLELAYFGGWTQTEIADRLDLPLGTVKGRTRLALDKLRSALEPSHAADDRGGVRSHQPGGGVGAGNAVSRGGRALRRASRGL
jgi:RNA polymerase sigma-70 factor (ECF subfamily)